MFSFHEYACLCLLGLPLSYGVYLKTLCMMLCYRILLLFKAISMVIVIFNPLFDTII